MSGTHRHLAFAGLTLASAACAEPPPTEEPPSTAEERIAQDLDRLESLELLELGAMSTTRPVDEQADRLTQLADLAEAAAAAAGPDDIAEDFWDEQENPSLCTRVDEESFCLDRQMHADNLATINGLEIVEVVDILRTSPAATGFCYSSWDTVHEDDCVRAIALDQLVDSAAD